MFDYSIDDLWRDLKAALWPHGISVSSIERSASGIVLHTSRTNGPILRRTFALNLGTLTPELGQEVAGTVITWYDTQA
ncbi:MAG: hypothetical protein M3Y37_07615 [Chloroflexota bacterium]|jgi:hypothetical protein|nr:hypothetical protein [Chloroflexota bacterium]